MDLYRNKEYKLRSYGVTNTTTENIYYKRIMKTKINTYEIENTNIGVYKNAKTTKRSDIIRLIDFLIPCQNYIKDHVLELRNIMDEKQQKEYKMNNLIGVTISALLGESRNTNNIIQHNNLMCVDVDEDDNKELFTKYNIEEIKEAIFNLDFVYCVCLSCRGKGFYFITPIPDSNDIDIYYTSMYYKLKGYGINIDKHCKDITRIRFGSYDSNILIKTDCEIEVFDEISEEQIREKRKELENTKRIIAKRNSYTRNEQLIYLEKSIKYLIYKGFDTGKHWSNWATVGKYLKTFGEYGKDLFHKLSVASSGYKGASDVEKNWNRFTQCNNEDEAFGKFYTMIRNLYGENWRKEMKEMIK